MTLAGAKWHVSELLTKLALESREAAAEYHRWSEAPRRRLSRRMRGLFSAGLLKAGAATAGGVAAVGIGAAVLFAMQGEDIGPGPAVPGLPFYMEAIFEREESAYSYEVLNRYWFQDESHQRVERGNPEVTRGQDEVGFGATATTGLAVIRDGATEWRPGPLYRGTPLEPRLTGKQSVPETGLGPLKYASIEDWLADIAATGGDFGSHSTMSAMRRRSSSVGGWRSTPAASSEPNTAAGRRPRLDRPQCMDRPCVDVVVRKETTFGSEIRRRRRSTKLTRDGPATEMFVFVPQPGG